MTATLEKTAGVNLYGILNIAKTAPPKKPKELSDLENGIASVLAAQTSLKGIAATDTILEEMRSKSSTAVAALRKRIFEEHGSLPTSLVDIGGYDASLKSKAAHDAYMRMSKAARVLLPDVRRLADDLGFLVVPVQYLSPLSGHTERNLAYSIEAFRKDAKELKMSVHVLTPAAFYGVREHALSEDPNLPCYDGKHVGMMYLARQNAATFRGMFREIGKLTSDLTALDSRVKTVEGTTGRLNQEVESLNSRVSRLEQYRRDDQRRREEIAQQHRREIAELRGELAIMRAANRQQVEDPMVFALREGIDLIAGDGEAYIGPCWGPDFDLTIATGRAGGAFDPVTQASTIKTLVNELWGSPK